MEKKEERKRVEVGSMNYRKQKRTKRKRGREDV